MDAGCPDPGKTSLLNAAGSAQLTLNGCGGAAGDTPAQQTSQASSPPAKIVASYVPLLATSRTNTLFRSNLLSITPGMAAPNIVRYDSLSSPMSSSSSPLTLIQPHSTSVYSPSKPTYSALYLTLLSIKISGTIPTSLRQTAAPSLVIVPQPLAKSLVSSAPLLRSTSPSTATDTCLPTAASGSSCHEHGASSSWFHSASNSVTSSFASQRTITPVISAQDNDLGGHTPSWYIGIVFGIIGGIALLFCIISFVICAWKRTLRRRRARDTVVPWASVSGDEEQGVLVTPSGRLPPQNAAMDLEDLAYVQAWSPSGDRDVGEPRRVARLPPVKERSMYTLHDHPIPTHGLFSGGSLTGSRPTMSSKPLHPRNTLRHLPSHLIDEDLAARAVRQEGDSAYSRIALVPAAPLRRRSRSRLEDAVDCNPYIGQPSNLRREEAREPQQTMAERLRNHGKREDSWDRLPTPGRDQPREDFEPWAASFRANLVNAFNTLAAGLGTTRPAPNTEPEDNLTTAPIRHSLSRGSPSKLLSRRMSSSTSLGSKEWILHEKGDGTGTVQFLPSLDKYGRRDRIKQKPKLSPILSFGSGEKFSSSEADEKTEYFQKPTMYKSLVPLVVSSAPEKAIIRPESPLKRFDFAMASNERSLLSRPNSSSSVYSTSSSLNSRSSNQGLGASHPQYIHSFGKHSGSPQ